MAKPRPCSRSQACTPDGESSPKAEPPGQHHGVDRSHRAVRVEQVGFARAGRAAAHVDGRGRGLVEQDRGHAGGEAGVVGMADPDARDVGDEVSHGHGETLALPITSMRWGARPPCIGRLRRRI